MAVPNRLYWAITALGVADDGAIRTDSDDNARTDMNTPAKKAEYVPGVQSVGITTTFNLEQIFQLGQLALYQDYEEVPDIEITVEKTIDDYDLLYNRGMGGHGGVIQLQNNKKTLVFQVGNDGKNNLGDVDNTTLGTFIVATGMYVSSASFSFPTDGNFTESITFVGNNKRFVYQTQSGQSIRHLPTKDAAKRARATDVLNENDGSSNVAKDTGVKRRQHFVNMGALSGIRSTNWVDAVTTNKKYGVATDTGSNARITNISVSADFGRENINILGQKDPFLRFVSLPFEVTTEVEVLASGTDVNALTNEINTGARSIVLQVKNTPDKADSNSAANHTFGLGDNNTLTSVAYGGGTTGGENSTMTFSYRNFNELSVVSASGGHGQGDYLN